ncbi:hypothetical protein ACFODO_20620 [Acinetobacter sichuanensis]|uniref:Uncharacterized protein n=1 Tax=Acinetobacter sichuanensis TaxID=2136183 RepID=A0A371YJF9_9GAMM|nr:hypothetical protein [Acinetobacter sichuanensis]RFC81612.1 hypothetical protein C9E89_020905 [Acinetobacter sichuanensis]
MSNNNESTTQGMSESDSCNLVANIILILCIVLSVVYIVSFGKVETIRYSEYAGEIATSSWSFAQILMGISIAIGGAIWWYLFQKIGSVLRHLEELKAAK